MPDDKAQRGGPDRSRVSGEEQYEVAYFAEKSGLSNGDAHKATEQFGISRTLALEEIAMIVEEAKADGETVRVGYHAGMLAFTYPDSGMSLGRLCDELIFAASIAGVVAEMYRAGYGHGKNVETRDGQEEQPAHGVSKGPAKTEKAEAEQTSDGGVE